MNTKDDLLPDELDEFSPENLDPDMKIFDTSEL